MKVEVNETFFAEIEENGTIMDYVDDELLFVYKDDEWCDHEIKSLQSKPCVFHFGSKYDIPFFLLTIEDALDTSDFIFNPHECDQISDLFQKEHIEGSIYLIDQKNVVKAKKNFQLSKNITQAIQSELQRIMNTPYFEAEFQCNVDGIMDAWEPFELAEMFSITCNV